MTRVRIMATKIITCATARSRSEFPIASGLMAESIGDLAGGTDQPSISDRVLRTSEVRLLA
jgi:hypothetical protein